MSNRSIFLLERELLVVSAPVVLQVLAHSADPMLRFGIVTEKTMALSSATPPLNSGGQASLRVRNHRHLLPLKSAVEYLTLPELDTGLSLRQRVMNEHSCGKCVITIAPFVDKILDSGAQHSIIKHLNPVANPNWMKAKYSRLAALKKLDFLGEIALYSDE